MSMLLLLALWLSFGAASAYCAQFRGRDPVSWFVLGMLFGLVTLIVLFLLPKLEINSSPTEEPVPQANTTVGFDNPRFKSWYYLDTLHVQQGPLSFLNLEKMFDQNLLSPTTLVWCDGMSEWKEINNVVDLKKEPYVPTEL